MFYGNLLLVKYVKKKCPYGCKYEERKCPPTNLKALSKLQIECCYKQSGCPTVVLYEALEKRENECNYQLVICNGCQKQLLKIDFDRHQHNCGLIDLKCTQYKLTTKYKLLSPFQSGFIAKDSTTNMLLDVVHEINAGLEDHHYVRAVLLDFQKAFDNVSHRGLLLKLEKKGIRGKALKWLESYLTGRMIQTILEGVISSPLKIDKGVPQGSVL
ncbi:unnamed protein product, partial [Didymodactylos carnosus]